MIYRKKQMPGSYKKQLQQRSVYLANQIQRIREQYIISIESKRKQLEKFQNVSLDNKKQRQKQKLQTEIDTGLLEFHFEIKDLEKQRQQIKLKMLQYQFTEILSLKDQQIQKLKKQKLQPSNQLSEYKIKSGSLNFDQDLISKNQIQILPKNIQKLKTNEYQDQFFTKWRIQRYQMQIVNLSYQLTQLKTKHQTQLKEQGKAHQRQLKEQGKARQRQIKKQDEIYKEQIQLLCSKNQRLKKQLVEKKYQLLEKTNEIKDQQQENKNLKIQMAKLNKKYNRLRNSDDN